MDQATTAGGVTEAAEKERAEYPARPRLVRTSMGNAYARPDRVLGLLPGGGQAMGMTLIVFDAGPAIGVSGTPDQIAEALWPGISGQAPENPIGRIGPRGPGGAVILGHDGRAA